jgi:hypothetical protein
MLEVHLLIMLYSFIPPVAQFNVATLPLKDEVYLNVEDVGDMSWSCSHLRGRLIDGEDTGGELPEAGEPDVELAPVIIFLLK